MARWWLFGILVACSPDADTDVTVADAATTPATTPPALDEEICDGADNDGDGEIDEGVTTTYYLDADGDGYGVPDSTIEACELPFGYSVEDIDCDDTDPLRLFEGANDACDGADNDCDGAIDEDHRADWILATVHDDDNVREIDISTGQTWIRTQISGIDNYANVNSADSLDANILMLQTSNLIDHELVQLDSCTGVADVLGPHGQGNLPGIAYGPNWELYGIDSLRGVIVQLDTFAVTGQPVLDLGFVVGASGLAYDCTTERIWVADAGGSQIFWYDPDTNTVGDFIPTNVPFQGVGLEWDNATRTLLASTGTELWRIDPNTGDASYESTFDVENVNDLVLLQPCP
jgi:hypothetical protein